MKRSIVLFVVLAMVAVLASETFARGRGGGRRGYGAGRDLGGPSRSVQPTGPGAGGRPRSAPRQTLPSPGTQGLDGRPSAGARAQQLEGFLSQPATGRQRGAPETIRQDIASQAADVFDAQWWASHPRAARARWHYNHPWAHWYRPVGWAAVTGFVAGTASSPTYNYGETIYYDEGTIYVEGEGPVDAETYGAEAAQLARLAPDDVDDDGESWMPLGVFALLRAGQAAPTMYMQLAVRHDGVLAGTYHERIGDTTTSIRGRVDPDTQRAAWTVGDDGGAVFETGIYNLTSDQTEVLVYMTPETVEEWLLIRLEAPAGSPVLSP